MRSALFTLVLVGTGCGLLADDGGGPDAGPDAGPGTLDAGPCGGPGTTRDTFGGDLSQWVLQPAHGSIDDLNVHVPAEPFCPASSWAPELSSGVLEPDLARTRDTALCEASEGGGAIVLQVLNGAEAGDDCVATARVALSLVGSLPRRHEGHHVDGDVALGLSIPPSRHSAATEW